MNTAIIIIGGSIDPFNVKTSMTEIVEDTNGTVIQTIASLRSQRNLDLLEEVAKKIIFIRYRS